ncbi:MAG: hypothetical protein NTY46_05570 [Candidatus Sumerlaeota bacterium]|nr:hypothetical protein [Candidatus Sumerlaeota bacterium]
MSKGVAFIFILLSLLFQILSMIFGKYASLQLDRFTPTYIMQNYYYLASFCCLGLQAVCWPLALRRFPLFWSYMFMSCIYVAIPLISHFIFKEEVSPGNAVGSVIVMAGILVIAATGGQEAGHA